MSEAVLQNADFFARLFMATFLGAVIGIEREISGKEAGFRTHSLVSLGSALIMIVSVQVYDIYHSSSQVDPSRIAAQVVSGIGFLGAGAIIRGKAGVQGLTTAACLWVAAGIGLACGLGQYAPAIATTILVIAILALFSRVDRFFAKRIYKDRGEKDIKHL